MNQRRTGPAGMFPAGLKDQPPLRGGKGVMPTRRPPLKINSIVQLNIWTLTRAQFPYSPLRISIESGFRPKKRFASSDTRSRSANWSAPSWKADSSMLRAITAHANRSSEKFWQISFKIA